jgi:hypothetical protein
MDTQLKTGRVRLVISGPDRRLTQAVLSRFLNWWDASGHRDLVASNDIVPLPDVSWSANSASISLPVNYECPTDSEPPTSFEILSVFPSEVGGGGSSTIAPALSIEPYEVTGVVGGQMPSTEAHDAAAAGDLTFHVVGDLSDAMLMHFPSESDAARHAAKIAEVRAVNRTRRRRVGPVVRAWSRRVAAASVAVASMLLRVLTLPVSLTAAAIAQCSRYVRRTLPQVGRAVASGATMSIVGPWRVIAWLGSWAVAAITQCSRSVGRTLAQIGRVVASAATISIVAPWRLIMRLCSLTGRATGHVFAYGQQAVPGVSRRIAAIGAASALAIRRAITIPWSLTVLMTKASNEHGERLFRSVARGSSRIVAPRMVMRAAFVSVVLAVAITAPVARPSRVANVVSANVVSENATVENVASGNVTAPATAIAARVVEAAPLPSRSLAMFTAPPRMSRVPVVVSRRVATPAVKVAKSATPPARLAKVTTPSVRLAKAVTPPVRLAKVATQGRKTKQTTPALQIATVNQEYVSSLTVMSEPSGATVRIDGRAVGTTPLQLDGVRVGSHAVHVALDGYPAWSAAATVVYGKPNGVVARLGK